MPTARSSTATALKSQAVLEGFLVCYTASSHQNKVRAAQALESDRIRAYSRYQLLPHCQRNC